MTDDKFDHASIYAAMLRTYDQAAAVTITWPEAAARVAVLQALAEQRERVPCTVPVEVQDFPKMREALNGSAVHG